MTYRKKLIEVALPLEAINVASAREKSIRHGHPSTLHLWWARRPLAACRAVIFTSLVDDPDDPEAPAEFIAACRALPKGPNATANDTPRQRLFDFIERLVTWEATTDEAILDQARILIRLCTNGNPPPLLDPFAGGGSIPLEAQRLGLEAHASDLNPVAVLINKALIEIPPLFADRPPVNPRDRASTAQGGSWKGAAGLAADVRYYGQWMRDRAWERIGHLYPQCEGETVIAWLWARTVRCPNPACGVQMPLVRSFELSRKTGNRAWVLPHVDPSTRQISFGVESGTGTAPEGTVGTRGAHCLACGSPVPFDHIRSEGRAGHMGARLMAVVTEGPSGRRFCAPNELHEQAAVVDAPSSAPDTDMPKQALGFRVQAYGMIKHRHLFTPRQLVALTTFSDLITMARGLVKDDATAAGLSSDETPLRDKGKGALAYAEALSVYLALSMSRVAMGCNTLARWNPTGQKVQHCFGRQALAMVWDFADPNPFTDATGSWASGYKYVADPLELRGVLPIAPGTASQQDAAQLRPSARALVSTDPPYYDNVGYADLSDFFYVWLRPALAEVYRDMMGTVLVPKSSELVATPYRFGGDRSKAKRHFEDGMHNAFTVLRDHSHPDFPLTVYYAFKQSEGLDDELSSSGWETMLSALLETGYLIDGTWPIRTEMKTRLVASGTNALASSVVLVCRHRPDNAQSASRAQFVRELAAELPRALRELQSGSIAPVDLAQAAIGPGMAVYSRYRQVLEANGERLSVRTALQLINQRLDEYLASVEGELDADSRFAVAWFEQFGLKDAAFGEADVLARAKNTAVDALAARGLLHAGAGRVRLLGWGELDEGWDPSTAEGPSVWMAVHQLVSRLDSHGEEGAALLLARMSADLAADARQLAYRLYSICERKGWAEQARDYNGLVAAWGGAQVHAAALRDQALRQGRLDI
jgi:putative DNA methylase